MLIALSLGTAAAQDRSRPPTAAAAESVREIVALLERDDLAAAQAAAGQALAADPDDPALHNLAGVIAARRGDVDEAADHFEAAIRFAPGAASPYENLGRLYLERTGRDPEAADKALDVYRRLLEVQPASVEGLYQAAFLLARSGEFQESRELVERLPSELQSRPQVLAVLAADVAGVGDPAATELVTRLATHPRLTTADITGILPALDRAADQESVARLLQAADRRGLAPPDALHRLGLIHARHQRFEAAREVLDRAAAASPSGAVLLDLARVAEKLDLHKEALGYLAHARALEPDNAQVHFLFGLICVELELGAEAYESLKRAVALTPNDPDANYALGAVSIHRHEPAEAIPYFERYLELRPDDARGRFALGAALFYANQFERSRDVLELAAKSPETAAGAHFFLARIARRFNDIERARTEIDQSLAANRDYPDAWAELGLIQMRQEDYAGSERSLLEALKLEPDNYAATVNLARLYSRTKDPRRDDITARVAELQKQRDAAAQEFLRIIEVVP